MRTGTIRRVVVGRRRHHACDRRPNFLADFLADIVSFCQVWFGDVYFCGDMAELPRALQSGYNGSVYSRTKK